MLNNVFLSYITGHVDGPAKYGKSLFDYWNIVFLTSGRDTFWSVPTVKGTNLPALREREEIIC